MMGRQAVPAQLFYDFSIEEHVPLDHLLRRVDRFLDFEEMRAKLKPFYSRIGRPSIDPELMIRMLIVGYVMGIRSERRLCEEVHLNLAYRWFCRLGLDGRVPDHSTFSLNRHGRFRQSDLLRHVFEETVETCIAEGLVGGQTFAADASMIEAEANRERSMAGADWEARPVPDDAPRAVREYLATLDDAAFGGASPVKPRFVSPSDPAAQWTAVYRRRAIFAYDYDPATGAATNRRDFVTVDASRGSGPDGATVDEEGFVWSATVFDGRIFRYAPDGSVDRVIDMPVCKITSLTFGGPDLDRLYVTSMAEPPLPKYPGDGPLRGSVFVVTGLGVRGRPEPKFAG